MRKRYWKWSLEEELEILKQHLKRHKKEGGGERNYKGTDQEGRPEMD